MDTCACFLLVDWSSNSMQLCRVAMGADIEGSELMLSPLIHAANQGWDRVFEILVRHGASGAYAARKRLDNVRAR
jgi:hypothetical protein